MRFTKIFAATAIAALMSANAMAQATAPTAPATTTTTKPAAKSMGNVKPVQTDVSKACSTQADAKALHGKERKTFRSAFKKNGGKA